MEKEKNNYYCWDVPQKYLTLDNLDLLAFVRNVSYSSSPVSELYEDIQYAVKRTKNQTALIAYLYCLRLLEGPYSLLEYEEALNIFTEMSVCDMYCFPFEHVIFDRYFDKEEEE